VSRPDAGGRTLVMVSGIAIEGGLAVLAFFLGWLLGQRPLETLALNANAILVGFAGTLPLIVLFFALMRWPVGPLVSLRRFTLEVICPMLAPCTVPDLAAIALLAGFGEEMLFRGTLQAVFARSTGPLACPWTGLALASVFFGLMHAVTPAYAVVTTLMGAYLGWLWILTGNILTPIIVHALYDFVVLYYLLAGPGRSLWENQAAANDPADAAGPSSDPSGR
jgi:membrane protease YdiL (CAAX protease family)